MDKGIHATAIVSKKAQLGKGVCVGPYSIVEDNVVLGESVTIGAHCVIQGNTSIGKGTQVFNSVIIGSQPQDLKYKGEKNFLEIGENNIIREFCTFNPGTGEGGKTIIGSNNLFMAYSHVAHDCRVGSHCIIANNGTLAGHVTVEDHVILGGLAAIHQFVRVGKLSIIGGLSKAVQDIPPFSTCDGHRAVVYGLNVVGLKRNGFSREAILQLRQAFRILFNSGFSAKHAIEKIEDSLKPSDEITYLVNFVKDSQRGVSHASRVKRSDTDQEEQKTSV
ncbi:MAG: acyl-ACP--UDP-N-acetylglucosamine O-acyltransferase [Candidatus Omnitrophota bacterium]|jgi:UDP-N-acetylglucosamine acyltransferase